MISEQAHRENYLLTEAELQTALTGDQLADRLNKIVAAGHGSKPVGLMFVEGGLTGVIPVRDCFVAEPYDGEHIALTERRWYVVRCDPAAQAHTPPPIVECKERIIP